MIFSYVEVSEKHSVSNTFKWHAETSGNYLPETESL